MERHIYSYQSDVTPFYYPLEYADLSWDATKVPAAALADRFDLERNYANVTISLDRMVRYLWPSGFKGLGLTPPHVHRSPTYLRASHDLLSPHSALEAHTLLL